MNRFVIASIALFSANVSVAQAPAWRAHGGSGVCVASSATAPPTDANGCGSIAIPSDAFQHADAVLRPGGPHRYELDAATTHAERAHHASACCYVVRYPPPPPG